MKTLRIFLVMTLSISILAVMMVFVLASSGALAAANVGPTLSIPIGIPASPSSTVIVPVQYTSNGNSISSMIFSVDFSNTFLQFNPSLPFSITMNLPAGFTGDCSYDLDDLDGEIDCFVLDPIAPLAALPDGVIASIKLETGAAPPDTLAPVGFSTNSPPPSFGNTLGQSVVGSTVAGSVIIGPTSPTEPPDPSPTPTDPPAPLDHRLFLPMMIKGTGVGCSNLVKNGGFETNTHWLLPVTTYTAQYTTLTAKSGAFSMQTGIYNPHTNVNSYSSARQLVTIPADATSAVLSFYRLLFRDQLVLSPPLAELDMNLPARPEIGKLFPEDIDLDDDVQMVLVMDIYGNTQRVLLWTIANNAVWVNESFDLLDFAGETVQLYFGTYNNGQLKVSALFVDDVALTVCR